MSYITEFYRERKPDHRGRTLVDLWDYNLDELEGVHDYIQWLFPLPEPSRFNPHAPILVSADCRAFADDPVLRDNFTHSYLKMLDFYGLECDATNRVNRAAMFDSRRLNWITPGNHNFLRLSRIIQCVALLKSPADAAFLVNALADIFEQYGHIIGERSFSFWKDAATKRL